MIELKFQSVFADVMTTSLNSLSLQKKFLIR